MWGSTTIVHDCKPDTVGVSIGLRSRAEGPKRKLNFDDSASDRSTDTGSKGRPYEDQIDSAHQQSNINSDRPSGSASSVTDNMETQFWEAGAEDYVNCWLEQQKMEHAASVEKALARERGPDHEADVEELEKLPKKQKHADVAAELKGKLCRREQLGQPVARQNIDCMHVCSHAGCVGVNDLHGLLVCVLSSSGSRSDHSAEAAWAVCRQEGEARSGAGAREDGRYGEIG